MPLGPLQIHAHEHLDPVLSLHPTLADGDRDHGVVIRIWIGEEQIKLARAQLGRDRRLFFGDLLGQLRVARRQLVELDQVAGALLQLFPGFDQLPVLSCFARQPTGAARVVPDTRLR